VYVPGFALIMGLVLIYAKGLSQATVRKRLAKAEAKAAKDGLNSILIHDKVLPAMFINIGLKLKDSQYVPRHSLICNNSLHL
jgi:hypothetical protein